MLCFWVWFLTACVAFATEMPDSLMDKMRSPDATVRGRAKLAAIKRLRISPTNETWAEVIRYGHSAYDDFTAARDTVRMAVACLEIADAYNTVGDDMESALGFALKGYALVENKKHLITAFLANMTSVVYGKTGRVDEAEKYAQITIQSAQAESNYYMESNGWAHLAKYRDVPRRDWRAARENIRKAIDLVDFPPYRAPYPDFLLFAAEIENELDNPAEAVALLDRMESVSDTAWTQKMSELYWLRSQVHDKLGHSAEAYRDLLRTYSLMLRIKSAEGTQKLKEMEARLKLSDARAEKAEIAARYERQRLWLGLAAGALGLGLLLGGFWAYRSRARLKISHQARDISEKSRALTEQLLHNKEIEALRAEEEIIKLEALAQMEVEKRLKAEAETRAEAEQRERLKAQAEAERLRNRLVEQDLKAKLAEAGVKLESRTKAAQAAKQRLEIIDAPQVKRVTAAIEENLQDHDAWLEFKAYFDQVHEGFFDRLHLAFPDLTATDVKIAAFLRMNKSSKDVADALKVSPDSVDKSRYRLRKKLSLSRDENLASFIQKI